MADNLPNNLIGRVGFGALLLTLALTPFLGGIPPGPTYPGDVGLGALRCLALVASLCLALSPGADADNAPTPGQKLAKLLMAGVVALTILSFLIQSRFFTSPVLLFASLPGMLDWVCYGLLFFAGMRFGNGRARSYLIGSLFVGAGLSAVLAVQEYGQYIQGGMPEHRAQGLFFSPNFSAGLMALLLPIGLALYLSIQQRLAVLALGALVAILTGALLAAGSRAALVFAGAGLLIVVVASLLQGKRLPGLLPRIGVFAVIVLALGFAFRGPLAQRVAASGQEQSGPFRTWTWKGTIHMAQEHPILGTGPGTYPYLYPSYALVARTDLAHSSYLQMAAEQGVPALLLAVGALVVVSGSAVLRLLRSARTPDTDAISNLLLAGALGGLLAGMARSLVDSEWSILGNAFPFWTVLGMVAGGSVSPQETSIANRGKAERKQSPADMGIAAGALAALVLALLCLNTVQQRAPANDLLKQGKPYASDSFGWPPDPQLLYYGEKLEEAARIEPTGKRYYQLARYRAEKGDINGAIEAFKQSVAVEPTTLQAWRRLAEAQERMGDNDGALQSWRKVTELHEGPAGKVRAIPEATETHPAFAYAALARDAAKRGNVLEASTLYDRAAGVVESYAKTPDLYQQMEAASAQVSGLSVQTRREEIRSLYQKIILEWSELQKERTTELTTRRDETLALLDKMLTPSPAPSQ